jgi:hypothetical protein
MLPKKSPETPAAVAVGIHESVVVQLSTLGHSTTP